ncbi:protein kinase domain-containing protein [Amycolatopsis alba]|uniref:Serine/threonine protein kinase n=1 Tax=Amycolatopsis alba DSM 44262 TaxID=1125972 RepID=A0A229S0H7_AMYAL|nr:protein kinase [Amycolatopsis alba]OXM52442.1 serine/threonine protein kinase [Amycolatopsis alba DSM 44262]
MKRGDSLNGYLVVTKPTNEGAGKCLWAFAERDGHEYFVKEFLDPKRPGPYSMGDEESKRLRREQCEEFERRHWAVINQLDPTDPYAGNLVTALDFFCVGTTYYKVTARMKPVPMPSPEALSAQQKIVLLGTLGDSLALLHRKNIVHGDLKPDNVLLHRPPRSDLYTAKLIDFDDAYLSGSPPDRDTIGGDAGYASPELLRYLKNDPAIRPEHLTTAADMFAFGLLLHGYLTGAPPGFAGANGSVAEAVNAGADVRLDSRLSDGAASLIRALLGFAPRSRPTAEQVLRALGDKSFVDTKRSRLRINV